jgi:hypothetical protein
MVSIILWGQPSLSETSISEQTLTSDIVIKALFQPGSGLPVGKIYSVQGEAFVFHRDPTVGYRIHTGLPLYVGDIIRTSGSARIFCRLIDGSNIILIPETFLTIVQSSYNTARKTGMSFLFLEHGGARFNLNPNPELISYEFKVQTELAFTVARDADFVVKATKEATDIVVFENSRVEVSAMAQPEETTYLSGYQRTVISEGTIAPRVDVSPREYIENLMSEFHSAPRGTFLAARPKGDREDSRAGDTPATEETRPEEKTPIEEETIVEEDITEPRLSE